MSQNNELKSEERLQRMLGGYSSDANENELELERQNAYLRALNGVSLALMNHLDVGEVLEGIVEKAAQLIGTAHGYIAMLDDSGQAHLEVKVSKGDFRHLSGKTLPLDKGLSGKVLQVALPVIVEDCHSWQEHLRNPVDESQFNSMAGFPLVDSESEILGTLCLAFRESERIFKGRDVELLSRFAQLASLALDNAQMYAAAQQEIRLRRQIEARLQLSDEILSHIHSLVLVLDEKGYVVYASPSVRSILGYKPDELLGTGWDELTWTNSKTREIEKQSVISQIESGLIDDEYQEVERRIRCKDGSFRWFSWNRTFASIPEPRLICVGHDITERKDFERRLLEAQAELQQWVDELAERNREIGLMTLMSTVLQSCQEFEVVYLKVVDFAEQFFPQEAGRLMMHDLKSGSLEMVSSWGEDVQEPVEHPSQDCLSFGNQSLQVGLANDLSSRRCPHFERSGLSYLCAPIYARRGVYSNSEPVGVINLWKKYPEDTFSESQKQLVGMLCEQIGLTLENLFLRDELKAQAVRDPLTGLYNRRYLFDALDREIKRASHGEYPVGVLMLDLDHFKQINDTYGHAVGDAVLSEVGKVLSTSIRGRDIACRYGGEEFVLALIEADIEAAVRRAEEIWQQIGALEIEIDGIKILNLSVSIGVAAYPRHGDSCDEILVAADLAMYQAKDLGRNRVVHTDDVDDEP